MNYIKYCIAKMLNWLLQLGKDDQVISRAHYDAECWIRARESEGYKVIFQPKHTMSKEAMRTVLAVVYRSDSGEIIVVPEFYPAKDELEEHVEAILKRSFLDWEADNDQMALSIMKGQLAEQARLGREQTKAASNCLNDKMMELKELLDSNALNYLAPNLVAAIHDLNYMYHTTTYYRSRPRRLRARYQC